MVTFDQNVTSPTLLSATKTVTCHQNVTTTIVGDKSSKGGESKLTLKDSLHGTRASRQAA
jgi:hypothetical protein